MAVPPPRPPILVLGIGNILLSDEGIGVHVIEALQGTDLPGNVELVDGGTAGADLIDVLSDRRKVIVVDAMDANCEPGSILRLRPTDLMPQASASVSLHEIGLLETLQMVAHIGSAPDEVVIFGVKPKRLAPGLELSEELKASVPRVVESVLAELGS